MYAILETICVQYWQIDKIMAKKVEQQRVAKIGNEVQLEQTIASDDSLLPSAKELTASVFVDWQEHISCIESF